MDEYKITFEVLRKEGLHMRPAGVIVNILSKYGGASNFSYKGENTDGRSIMSLVMLCAGKGAKIDLTIRGEGAKDIADKIINAANFD